MELLLESPLLALYLCLFFLVYWDYYGKEGLDAGA
jgi:hypothetical protein